jgi:spore germination cell wall hydrolase CwlJ-like protein
MNFKKIVTVIVAGLALCFMLSLPCEAATTTATTEENTKREYTESELRYMSSIIYCEARGESYAGQKAVGIVVMNRVRSKLFPNSVKKVIYQKGQFSPVRNGSLDKALAVYDKQNSNNKFKGEMKSCRKAAVAALEGSTTIKVNGKRKQMKSYLYFSRYVKNARFTLGGHQFK